MGNANAARWHKHDSGHRQLERPEQWSAGQCFPRQLSTTACETPDPVRGLQGRNLAPTGTEEPLADVWSTAGEPDAGLDLSAIVSLPASLQPRHPHQQQQHGSLGPCTTSSPRHGNQRRPLSQQRLQIQNGIRTAIFPQAAGRVHGRTTSTGGRNRHQATTITSTGLAVDASSKGKKAAGSVCSGGLGDGGWGRCGKVVDGRMVAGSPKSSVLSDESAEALAEKSPIAGQGRKRGPLEAAEANAIALLQPRIITGQGIHDMEQHLLCTGMELESAGNGAAGEESRNKEDDLNQLLQFIRIAMLERDEARDQLQKLHAKIAAQRSPHEYNPAPAHRHGSALLPSPELPDLSEAHCVNSEPAQPAPRREDVHGPTPPGLISSGTSDMFDPSSAVIDCLAANKALPEKGKLLQAVLDAGPLLQTLLIAGTLPRWRNPLAPQRSIQVPPLSATLDQNAVLDQQFLSKPYPL